MAVEFFDHTADVGVRISAESLETLFSEAAVALTETVTDPAGVSGSSTVHVSLHTSDLDQLLVDWLSELVALFDIERFLAASAKVTIREAGGGSRDWTLEASVSGERCETARHPLRVLVKGITYHGLGIRRTAQGRWATSVVFDV
jgi:SHS2 domain-containing protein